MIIIKKSRTADTRSCDFSQVTKEQLTESSKQHINDVRRGIGYFIVKMSDSAYAHDRDKLTDINQFHEDFITGFKQTGWWDKHRKINRHHLLSPDGVPDDVNLVDVIEMIVDCVMAGMGRTGEVYPLEIGPDILMKAFQNTSQMLKAEIKVED